MFFALFSGVPLLHISHNAIIFEKPSIASLNHVEKVSLRF